MNTSSLEQRRAYTNRIEELRSIPYQDRRAGKALPARPETNVLGPGRDWSRSSTVSTSDDSVVDAAAAARTFGQDDDSSPVAQLPSEPSHGVRPGSVVVSLSPLERMPAPLLEAGRSDLSPTRLPPMRQLRVRTDSLRPGDDGAALTIVDQPRSVDPERALSRPGRPSSPVPAPATHALGGSPHARTESIIDMDRLRPPLNHQHRRGDSNGSTSWLDTIDESGNSSPSSARSRSSSFVGWRRRHRRLTVDDTEAAFDAALDAAVAAAYDDHDQDQDWDPPLDPDPDLDRGDPSVDWALRRDDGRALSDLPTLDREAIIARAKEHARRSSVDVRDRGRWNEADRDALERRRWADEERLLACPTSNPMGPPRPRSLDTPIRADSPAERGEAPSVPIPLPPERRCRR